MEQTEIVNIIIETINSIFSNLFSSIDNNIYEYLDKFAFIDSSIISDSLFNKFLGESGKNSILYLTDSLLLAVIIYYIIRYAYSSFSGNNIERPSQFLFKMVILGVTINSSYFILEQIININFLICESIREIGKSIINKDICFSEVITTLNSTISIGDNSFDLFSFDGIIKGFISIGLLNLLFSYSLRYIMVQVFILSTPLIFISLMNSSTYWIFKSWFKGFLSLLILQSFISIILIVMLSFDSSSKFLLIGSIYALIRANSYIKELFGGISVDISSNISSFITKFKT